jgi:hypothetical protein
MLRIERVPWRKRLQRRRVRIPPEDKARIRQEACRESRPSPLGERSPQPELQAAQIQDSPLFSMLNAAFLTRLGYKEEIHATQIRAQSWENEPGLRCSVI